MHMRDEAAAFAAPGEAQATEALAVCAGSCGPGNLHLVNGLYDAHHTRVAGPGAGGPHTIGRDRLGYLQEIYLERMSMECTSFCGLVFSPVRMPRMLIGAIRAALERRGLSALVIPGEAAMLPAEGKPTPAQPRPQTGVTRQAALSIAARRFRLDRRRRCSVSASRRPSPNPATPGSLPYLPVEGPRLRHVAGERRSVARPSSLPASFPRVVRHGCASSPSRCLPF